MGQQNTGGSGGGTTPAAWGGITGVLSNQTDLQTALNTVQSNANAYTDASFVGDTVPTISGMQAYSGAAKSVFVSDPDRGGTFSYLATGVNDNGITFTATGKGSGFWVRQYDGDVNVMWFGAIGNNSAVNDTTNINLAIASITSGKVVFPPGRTFYILTSILVTANLILDLNGSKLVPYTGIANNVNLISLNGAGCSVINGEIDGGWDPTTTNTGVSGVRVYGDNCTVSGMYIHNVARNAISGFNVNSPTVKHCRVISTGYISIWFQSDTKNTIGGTIIHNIVDRTAVPSATLSESGIYVSGTIASFTSIGWQIIGNKVYLPVSPTTQCACIVTFGGCHKSVVTGNITTGGTFGLSIDRSDNSAMSGNTIFAACNYGIEISGTQYATVTGNDIDCNNITQSRGIAMTSGNPSTNCNITGNNIKNCNWSSIYGIAGSINAVISNNTINTIGSYGIELKKSAGSVISGNRIDGASTASSAIMFDNGTGDDTIVGNILTNFTSYGIFVYISSAIVFDNVTIVGNVIKNCPTPYGVAASAGGSVGSNVRMALNVPTLNNISALNNDAAYITGASPALTGTPMAPTAAAGTNTTQLATTAYTTTAVASEAALRVSGNATTLASANSYTDAQIVSVYRAAGNWDFSLSTYPTTGTGVGGVIRRGDTYNVSVAGLGYDVGDAFYANINAPGQTAANWSRFEVNSQQATETVRGTGRIVLQSVIQTIGTTNDTDLVTAKKFWFGITTALVSPVLTGTPTTPTAAAGNSTLQIASTAFVQAAVMAGMTGTLNRITVASGAVDIAANYVGQSSLTTLGTVTTGAWNASPVVDAYISSATTWNNKVSSITGVAARTTVTGTTTIPIIDIASTYAGQSSIVTLGTVVTGTWNASVVTDIYISSATTWNNKVTSISGVLNRTTISGTTTVPVVDISATYIGQTSLTTLGTITTGTWNGAAIADAYISSAATWNAKLTNVVLNTPGVVFTSPVSNSTTAGVETLTMALITQSANTIFGGPSTGVAATPTFRALVAADLPVITSLGTVTTGVWNGTAIADAYISSAATWNAKLTSVVINTSGSIHASPISSTTTSGVQTFTMSLNTQLANVVFIGPTTGAAANPTFRLLVASDLPVIVSLGTVTTGVWNATAIADTYISSAATWNAKLTSVTFNGSGIFNISGSTTAGVQTINEALLPQGANNVFAGPSTGGATTPAFRVLVAADIPSLTGTYEVPLTFTSPGLLRTANTVTNTLMAGVTGGQTIIGGTGIADALTYKSTTGAGTTTATAHLFVGGTNGGTTILTLLNNGGAALTGDLTMTTGKVISLGSVEIQCQSRGCVFITTSSTVIAARGTTTPIKFALNGANTGSSLYYAQISPTTGNFMIQNDGTYADNGSRLQVVGDTTVSGNTKLLTAGNGFYVKEGTNATMGTATLAAGTVTVSTTKVTATSRIFIEVQTLGTISTPTAVSLTSRTAGTSFTITSASVADTSTVAWVIIEPS